MVGLRIAVATDGPTALMTLAGEADLAVAETLFEQGVAALGQDGVAALVIDLEQVSFIDSTSIGALVRLNNLVTDSGQTIALTRVPARVVRVLQIAGLTGAFDIS
jgi:anti-sigma B factor antagonist